MILKLTSNLTKIEYTFTGLTDTLESRLFYALDIQLPEGVDDGEYSYVLYEDDNRVLATGLCQIGDYVPEKKEYKQENKQTYIQYQS